MNKKHYIYILLTERNTYYCGYTTDVEKRYEKHCNGTGAKYTKAFKPVRIVYIQEFETKNDALKEEYKIKKKLTRKQKELLIAQYEELQTTTTK